MIGKLKTSKRGTGPRTPSGKARSKLNSLKHGLYSQAAVLSYESETEFRHFCSEIRRDLFAEGVLEETLADKIATTLWRYRRLLVAENAAIDMNVECQKDRDAGLDRSSLALYWSYEEKKALTDRLGYIRWADSAPESLEACLDKLHRILQVVDAYGLDHETVSLNLSLIFGARFQGREGWDLFDDYVECMRAFKSALASDAAKGSPSALECQRRFVTAAQKELTRLEALRKGEPRDPHAHIYMDGPTTGSQRQLVVPTVAQLDRLLRYETHLNRELNMTLNALKRAQDARDHGRATDIVIHGKK